MAACAHGIESPGRYSQCGDCAVDWLREAVSYLRNPIEMIEAVEHVAHTKGWACDELLVVMPLRQVQVVLKNGKGAHARTFNGRRGVVMPGGHADMRIVAAPRDDASGDVTVERHGDVLIRLASVR